MSGVWVLKDGKMSPLPEGSTHVDRRPRVKALVHIGDEDDVVITSYSVLEAKLVALGWEKSSDSERLRFRRPPDDIISLPKDFNKFELIHMEYIVSKNPYAFEVQDV